MQVLGVRVLGDVGHTVGPGYADAELVLGPGDVIVELLPKGPDVHEEYVGGQARGVFLGDHRLLDCVHAAHRRAVVVADVLVPRSHALDEGHLLGDLPIGGSHDNAAEGSGSR